MTPSNKTTVKITRPAAKKTDERKPSVLVRKPLVVLGALAAVPVLVMLAFTFKSGYTPAPKGKLDKIVVKQTPAELADEATAVLRKGDNNAFLELLDTKIKDINATNGRGNTLLLEAVNLGNEEAVGQLLSLGADVNRKNAFTRDTPLIRALEWSAEKKQTPPNTDLMNRKLRIAGQLLYAGADANTENNYKQSPMWLAVENQAGDIVNALLAGGGVTVGVNEATLFRSVATKNLVGVVGMLKGGVKPNVRNEKGNTPLIISSSVGDIPAVQALMSYGADVNAANNDGNTSLIYAARYNQPLVIQELLKPYSLVAPLDVDMQNKRGETALYWAASKGYEEAVLRLLAAGATPSIATKAGLTPLQAAEKNKRAKVIPWFSADPVKVKNRVIEIDNAAIIAQAKASGQPVPALTPEVTAEGTEDLADVNIFEVISSGNFALLGRLIKADKGAVFAKDEKTGFSPLHAAVKARRLEMAKLLADNMTTVADLSPEGSVLHLAVKQQDIEMLRMLVEISKKENSLSRILESKAPAPNKQMMTPLGFAAMNCNKEIYDYLVSVGAKPGTVSKETSMFGFYSPVELIRKCKQYKPSFRRVKPGTAAQKQPAKANTAPSQKTPSKASVRRRTR